MADFTGLGLPLRKSVFVKDDLAGAGTTYSTTASVGGYASERVFFVEGDYNSIGCVITDGVFTIPTTREVLLTCRASPSFDSIGGYSIELVELTGSTENILQKGRMSGAGGATITADIYLNFIPKSGKKYAIKMIGGFNSTSYNSGAGENILEIRENP